MAKKRSVYKINGKRVPGVTSLTGLLDKPQLMWWAVNKALEVYDERLEAGKAYDEGTLNVIRQEAKTAHQKRKTDAGDYGTDVHALIEAALGQQEIVMTEQDKRVMRNFNKETKGWKWMGAEIVVLNEEHMYGGTADAIALLPDGKPYLIDFKTSKGVYPEHELQLTMYAAATPEDEKYRKAWKAMVGGRIVHLDKERLTWEVLERDIHEQRPFIPHFRAVYEWVRENTNK